MENEQKFERWFEKATGDKPYPFQKHFACASVLPQLVDVPTGMGKTAMTVLGWLWRRRSPHLSWTQQYREMTYLTDSTASTPWPH